MSITFSPVIADADVRGFIAECHADYPNVVTVVREATYEAARVGAAAHKLVCEECDHYGIFTSADYGDMPEVNMSNTNAAFIIGLLGIEFDYCGSIDAAELLERVGFAQVVGGNDAGTPTVAYRAEGGATVVECGRHAGYADERLAQVAEVAQWAAAHGRQVQWA